MTEPVIKVAVLAVFGTVAALMIKRSNAEMAAVLSIAVCAVALYAVFSLVDPILELMGRAKEFAGLSGAVLSPVLKCVGIGLTSRIAADLCRDGGQGAVASTVELMGAVGGLYAALPLVSTLLDMLEELV